MFVPVWLIFVLSGVAMAILTIVWAVRSRQFEEQDRARYLPLGGLSADELDHPPPVARRADLYANLALVVIGIAALVMTLVSVIKYA